MKTNGMTMFQKYKVVLLHDIDETEQGGDTTHKKGNFAVAQMMPPNRIYLGCWYGEEDLKNMSGNCIYTNAVEGVDFVFIEE